MHLGGPAHSDYAPPKIIMHRLVDAFNIGLVLLEENECKQSPAEAFRKLAHNVADRNALRSEALGDASSDSESANMRGLLIDSSGSRLRSRETRIVESHPELIDA
jgi:hypothetical protein